ncbi:serine hydrolase [Kordiimonas aquimaris]|uniref:serine hydrolase n=1 Tax=Kordiimonas aquimaris TaxID=707591 RepID=UPI0021D2AF22|nr:serine hydrolase [Kordiimonas aquimaris]
MSILTIGTALALFMVNTPEPLDLQKIEAALDTRTSAEYYAGLAVGIVNMDQKGLLILGDANKTTSRPIDKDSIFEIGSITKTMTGILLSEMVLNGEVQLDDRISKYLPETVRIPMYEGNHITLRHLATHTSALPRLPSNLKPTNIANPYADYTIQDMYDFLSSYELMYEIGTKAEYSNLGMGLLGHILSLKANMPYEQVVTERILKPLGMNDTTITIPRTKSHHLTNGHNQLGKSTSHWDLPTLAGAGALRSTITDMMLYLSANMKPEASPLSSAIKMSHQFQNDFDTTAGLSIGLAWLIQKNGDSSVTWHNGGTGGYRSFIGFNSQKDRGVVILANSLDDVDMLGVNILNGDTKNLGYISSEEISLAPERLKQYTGDYQLAPNFILSITEEDGQLFAQATGQQKTPVFAKSNTEFFYKIVDASLTFVEKNGKVISLILHQGGDHPAKKIR